MSRPFRRWAVTVGSDPGSPVAPDWAPPFEFTGTVEGVRFDVTGEHVEDLVAQFRAVVARQ